MKYSITPASGDPSDVLQFFREIRLNIHCCRYWWLKHWKHQRLSFPFWRLYWNKNPGGYVIFEKQINLEPSKIILIPPNTPFSTDIIESEDIPDTVNTLEGGWIWDHDDESELIRKGYVLHFFIHFNLGYPFDSMTPGIYIFDINEDQLRIINQTINILKKGISDFGVEDSLDMNMLILSAVSSMKANLWQYPSIDKKIFETITYMNRNLGNRLTNDNLASVCNMSANSYARLFKQETGISPQRYLAKIRIEHACSLMHHTNLSINEIADYSGFSDRYYFTKVFNSHMMVSPAKYRKQVLLRKG